ncbi:hypothetical protein G3A43_38465 [Paraburkholderia aspalathi]|uniref:hypothetical protein n=1 Tax=Paraburkholderia nemoris TaxID=2793076 RepID=UPI00190BD961|nr:hypothetical protein [Paraburkholderia aspalathi]
MASTYAPLSRRVPAIKAPQQDLGAVTVIAGFALPGQAGLVGIRPGIPVRHLTEQLIDPFIRETLRRVLFHVLFRHACCVGHGASPSGIVS